jgi:DNA-binding GntR family transcriptional regulator
MASRATTFTVSSARRRANEMMRLEHQACAIGAAARQAAGPPARMAMTDLVPVEPPPQLGRVTIRELLHRVVPVTPIVRDRLATDDDRVLLVEQVVSLGDDPLFHAVGYSPVDTAERVSAGIRAIDRHPHAIDMAALFLELFGVPLGRVAVGVGAVRADLRTARLLKIEPGAATLVREFLQFDADGRPRSYNFTQFRPDRVRLVARQRMRQRRN